PSGAGKTLLRQALVASCNRDKVQCVVTSGREYATEDGLQKLICQALGVSDIDDLLERSSQLHATGMQIYLVVDDGHCLRQGALDGRLRARAGDRGWAAEADLSAARRQ